VSIAKDAEIGDDCVIRHNVTIGGVSGARPDGPIIGSGVEVGAGAVIIGRIRIGDGARIGPNAVVMTNVPAGAIAVAPATRILEPRRATHNNSLRPAMQEHEP
jgi:serine O-acetyltransferase